MEIKAFVTNLGKYNEGELIGEWVTFPIDEDKQTELFKRIEINEQYEEIFMTDYEAPEGIKISEYTSIDELNEMAEKLDSVDSWDEETLEALLTEFNLDEALNYLDDTICYSDCHDMTDVAERYCDECGILNDIPENLRYYFDFESFGRDMGFEGTFIFYNGNCYEVM